MASGFKKETKEKSDISSVQRISVRPSHFWPLVSPWIIEKARDFQKKKSISALLTIPKPLTVWIT